jgi:hypothetical protein
MKISGYGRVTLHQVGGSLVATPLLCADQITAVVDLSV